MSSMAENYEMKKGICNKPICPVVIAFFVASCIVVICVVTFEDDAVRMKLQYDASGLAWWKTAIVYQVYPRSFKDSDGDGVGDLRGITQKLDYLADLGIGAIWISPFYSSPMRDFGYDVSNYTEVDPMFGTMNDFDTLLKEAKSRGLKIIVDFVPNHTSNESMWFQESRKGPNNSYSDYYIWKDGVTFPNGSEGPPNNWLSVFGGSAWKFDTVRGQYYYHAFLESQADLNFYNPKVLEELKSAMRFWLDRGVSGFRLDALKFMFESENVTENEALLPVGNHDNGRVASRVGKTKSGAVTMLLLTLPGTPTSYYGDEIGMEDVFYTFNETRDPAGLHFGIDGYQGRSRDPERSPMQWCGAEHAGFSTGTPWLHVHEDFTRTNVKVQTTDPDSLLNLYRTLAKLRKHPSFQNRKLQYAVSNDNIVSYVRVARGWTKYLVLINVGAVGSTDDYSKSPVDSTLGRIVAKTNNFNSSDIRTGHTISLTEVTLQPGQGLVVAVFYQGS